MTGLRIRASHSTFATVGFVAMGALVWAAGCSSTSNTEIGGGGSDSGSAVDGSKTSAKDGSTNTNEDSGGGGGGEDAAIDAGGGGETDANKGSNDSGNEGSDAESDAGTDAAKVALPDGGESVSDGSTEASAIDAALLGTDAGKIVTKDSGAPIDSGSASLTFCQMQTATNSFCADFDEGNAETGWLNAGMTSDPGIVGGGTIGLDTSIHTSAPASFSAKVPALVTDGTNAEAILFLAGPVSTALDFNFDMDVLEESYNAASGNAAVFFQVEFGTAGVVAVARGPNQTNYLVINETGMPNQAVALPETAAGSFVHVEVYIRNTPDTTPDAGNPYGAVEVLFNNVVMSAYELPTSFQSNTATPQVDFGVFTAAPTGAISIDFDNFIADFYN